nr:dienelactone hydrolase family protein [Micromonospora sp. DSM 115978]
MVPEQMLLTTADGPTPATMARPEPETPLRGGVLVLHEAFGLTDHVGDVCRRFAASGWVAVAPSLFHRSDSPVYDYDDLANAREMVATLT